MAIVALELRTVNYYAVHVLGRNTALGQRIFIIAASTWSERLGPHSGISDFCHFLDHHPHHHLRLTSPTATPSNHNAFDRYTASFLRLSLFPTFIL